MNCKSSASWIFLNFFLVLRCHFFSKPTTQNNKNHHNLPIITKTMSSGTTSHATPVKAKTGKSIVKNKSFVLEKSPPWQHWSNQVQHPPWQRQQRLWSHWIKNQVRCPSRQHWQQQRHCRSCHPSQPWLLVQSNPTRPILRALLTSVIYRSTPRKNHTSLTFAIPLMSRANALSNYLMQVISLLVKKANWPSF